MLIMKKYDVGGLCNGILAGLVSITAGCGNVECGSAFAIGLVGAFVYQGSSMLLQKLKIDDPVDASPPCTASAASGACSRPASSIGARALTSTTVGQDRL